MGVIVRLSDPQSLAAGFITITVNVSAFAHTRTTAGLTAVLLLWNFQNKSVTAVLHILSAAKNKNCPFRVRIL